MQERADFTNGEILRPLLRFTLPILLALFLQAMYGAVDLAVVGWFGTAADVSAVSTGSQILQSVTLVVVALAVGTTVLLGQKLGEKKEAEAGRVIGGSICLFSLVAVLMTVLLELCAAPFASVLRAPAEAFARTVEYVRICAAGSVFIVAYNLLGSVFRGMGDGRTPLLAVAIACVTNIAGDLLFVGVFHWAAAGAAAATVLSQALSVAICFFVIRRRGLPFPFTGAQVRFDKAIIAVVLKLGTPIALQDSLVGISFLVILAIVNNLGLVASAGVGVAEKICGFIMLVPSSFMQSLSAFVAQNIGAGKPQRAVTALRLGALSSLAVGAVLFYLSFFHGPLLASIFARGDAAVIAAAADYLKAYAIDTLLVSFLFCFSGFFNGCGKTKFVMAEGILGAFGVRIPIAYLMSRRVPVSLFLIGLGTPCSTILEDVLCVVYFLWLRKRLRQPLAD